MSEDTKGFDARELHRKYAPAIAYVCVIKPDGSRDTGSAFHIGSGTFVTARHVVQGNTIEWFGTTEHSLKPSQDGKWWNVDFAKDAVQGTAVGKPRFAADDKVDVALLEVPHFDGTAHIPLGLHLDIAFPRRDMLLRRVVVMGYPPIPMTGDDTPVLVATSGEVTAVTNVRHTKHPVFLVSPMARGGLSGGPAILETEKCLGVVTEVLHAGDGPYETGYLAVLTVQPIIDLLAKHGVPKEQQHVQEYLDLAKEARRLAKKRQRAFKRRIARGRK